MEALASEIRHKWRTCFVSPLQYCRLYTLLSYLLENNVIWDERQNNRTATSLRPPFQANPHIMDLDFKIF